MRFSYRLKTKEGELEEGVMVAPDKFALARQVKEQGSTLLSAEEVTDAKPWWKKITRLSIGGVKLTEKIAFAKNLAAMIDAGLSLSRGLAVIKRQTKNKAFADVLTTLDTSVQKGRPLSEALAEFPKTFPPIFVSMVRAGEESGRLGEALRVVATQMERSYNLRRKIRGAMMYPSIILIAMIIIGILMLIFVVPTLTDTFTELNVELPKSTQFVIAVSDLLKNHTVLTLGGLIGVIIALIAAFRTKRGHRVFDWIILHIPVIRDLVKQTNAARMARTFSSLLTSGVEVVSALAITRDVIQNTYFKDVLREAEAQIQQGKSIADIFTPYEALYPPMVTEMIAVGEETGKLPDLLLQIATFYEDEVEQRTKDMSTIIEPFLMVIIGGGVGFFAVSMITPIYSLSSGI